ncbi:MAG: sulfite exporter TauE/SafE family protein [Acidimicrobiales bacterium]
MSLWAVLLTGLLAGGASCAAVQGGLLAGLVARRADQPAPALAGSTPRTPPRKKGPTKNKGRPAPTPRRQPPAPAPSTLRSSAREGVDDMVPVGGFLAGKLVSHVILGAALGLLGSALQLTPRTRATVQIMAGVVMLFLALDLLGLHWFRRITPALPASWGQRVRRNSRSNAAMGPTMLGVASVALPCGVTLSMEVLAVASGSALSGAAIMGVFVLGTAPLFAVIGYLARRSATALRGRLSVLAGAVVLTTALLSVNTGLVLLGAPVTLRSPLSFGGDSSNQAASLPPPESPDPATTDDGSPQRLVVDVNNSSYSPSSLKAKAGSPVQLVLRTNETVGCTRSIVVPKLNLQETLPKTGETVLDLGTLKPGTLRFTCGMGMYSGSIQVS